MSQLRYNRGESGQLLGDECTGTARWHPGGAGGGESGHSHTSGRAIAHSGGELSAFFESKLLHGGGRGPGSMPSICYPIPPLV